jgi:hypothetical protein
MLSVRFDRSQRSSFLTHTARYCWTMKPQEKKAHCHRQVTRDITEKLQKKKKATLSLTCSENKYLQCKNNVSTTVNRNVLKLI